MAQISYEEFLKFNQRGEKKSSPKSDRPFVRYFGLGDDGDVGVVRFNVATLDDIKIVSRHRVKTNTGKTRNVMCLRHSPDEPLTVCPLCEAGEKVSFRAFIPLLSYEQDENGNTVAVPCMWEQAPRIRETLKSFTMDYGDLRDYIFKIVRHGKHGDTGTTYTILPANQKVYTDEVFKKDFSGFENFDFERFVTTKSAEDMEVFLETGEFPNPFAKSEVTESNTKPVETVANERTYQPVNNVKETVPFDRKAPETDKASAPEEKPVLRRYNY